MAKKDKKAETSEEKKIKSILSSTKNIDKARKLIKEMSRDEQRELRAALNSSDRVDRYGLKKSLSRDDRILLLEMLDHEEEHIVLYGANELRPAVWSKTITLFDVYETDEENFEPYISPLATVNGVSPESETETSEQQGETAKAEGDKTVYTQISEILQANYEKPSEGWNSFTNNVRLAKTGDDIGKILAKHKKKEGNSKTHIDIRHDIQKVLGMTY